MEQEEYQFYNEQNQRQAQQASFNSPMNTYGSSIVIMTNPDNDLYKMELALKGLELDENGRPFKRGDPLMNNEGVNSVMGQMRGVVNQITIMSNVEDKHIEAHTLYLADTIIADLLINNKRYDCSSIVARRKVVNMATTTATMCMRRAYHNGERGFWKSSQQEITTRVEGAKPKSNMFSNILGWGKR